MNTKIITHGEPGKLLGNTRRNCPYHIHIYKLSGRNCKDDQNGVRLLSQIVQ
ncbi:unnamed protein product [Acanthoscelides obtectus]|uniref:Uncharacterized protein n=1 Tax=Acanthoscelides obtectus TaxID=200917 RepID=A0A9P0LVS2_ACAOB|nr:unnamed protein product [Acanthoscelides obtectus]CAH2002644.1 unnamed protein product [Acanthoscelides obtectus]CAK1668520.1 hypothetical protein AOBTE_LOCUS26455 [Acanthoscelides obtectus]CAK1668522.1 hypothetical protein AOBTE_LOCUS26457 [Acanthoscelides obtectus]